VAAPGAPNLYWALRGLPRPFADTTQAIRQEGAGVLLAFPELRNPELYLADDAAWMKLMQKYAALTGVGQGAEWKQAFGTAALLGVLYGDARAYYLEKGRTEQFLDGYKPSVLAGLYVRDVAQVYGQRMQAVNRLPVYTSRRLWREWNRELTENRNRSAEKLLAMLIPALGRVGTSCAALDRRIEALAAVEAVRMHAARTDGKLPRELDIWYAPVLEDPMTNEPFGYTPVGAAVVLESPPAEGEQDRHRVRYRVSLHAE
jgi:hypothetical protein